MRRLYALSFIALFAFGCTRPTPAPSPAAPAAAPAPAGSPGSPGSPGSNDPHLPARYGAPVSAGAAVPIAAVLKDPAAQADKTVLVEGKVRANCTNKGCWMELASSMEKGQPGCRVTFKDYGFFIPTNSQGADARVEGVLAVRTIAAADVAHLESEGGSFPNKLPDGTAREVRIVATGVELKK